MGSVIHVVTSRQMDIFLQQFINGLTLGCVYAVVALGYTMVYGIIQLINFAHGEVVMIGAMATIEAMKKANSTDPAKFGPEIFNVSFSGATGKVEFDAKGDRKDAEITIFKMTGGKIAPVSIVKNGVATAFVPAAAPVAAPAMAPAPAAAAPAATPAKPPEAPKK